LRYIVFLAPQAMGCVYSALGGYGTVDSMADVRQLVAALALPHDDCLIIDPALITADNAQLIAANLAQFPRPVVAFSSVNTAALDCIVVLAQRTPARFVFRGTANERSALAHAILLSPDADLCAALLSRIDVQLELLPPGIRERVLAMFRVGDGPHSPDALSAAVSLTRRSIDRHLADAGFVSARRLVEAAHLTSAYRVITRSNIPFNTIASLLGYKSQRTMDAQFTLLLDTTSGKLRARPLHVAEAADTLALRLTARKPHQKSDVSRKPAEDARPSLTLINGRPRPRHVRLKASGEPVTKP
jgi:AraC-like DNA-binding protein